MNDAHHHHHHHGPHPGGEEEDVQCNHAKGLNSHAKGLNNHAVSEMKKDPLLQQLEWSLINWAHLYEKWPWSGSKGHPSAELVEHVKELLPSEPGRVLVPLCGRSPDLRWLYDRGNTVVGLEGVEKPVKQFFDLYPDLQHATEDLAFGKLYKSSDGRLQVYVCDVTKVPPGALGKFDAVFDWGAYTAIRPGDRLRYLEVVKEAMKEDCRYFLEVCHDGPPPTPGLPHSISFRTVKLEFGSSRDMLVLKTLDISEAWGVDSLFDSHILMVPKDSK